MTNWDVESDRLKDSGKEFIETRWGNMCALLGVHHVCVRVYNHLPLPAEQGQPIPINIFTKFLATEKEYNWLETI